jgi:2-hydroxychromene-2-carboxylate isomerase
VHRPIALGRVVEAVSSVPFGSRSAGHRAYFFGREIQRWSEERRAPVMDGIPTHHANDTSLANGMLIAGLEQGLDIDQLAHAMLDSHWRDDADLADAETLSRLAQGLGLDPRPLLDAALSPAVQAKYEANTEEAIRCSVFGSPTYFVDGDMFYGQDRLDQVARALRQPYGGEWP